MLMILDSFAKTVNKMLPSRQFQALLHVRVLHYVSLRLGLVLLTY